MKKNFIIIIIIIFIILLISVFIAFLQPKSKKDEQQKNNLNQEEQYEPLLDIYGEVKSVNDNGLTLFYQEFDKSGEFISSKEVRILIDAETKIVFNEMATTEEGIQNYRYDAKFSDIEAGSKIIVLCDSDMRGKNEIQAKEIRIIVLK